MFNDLFTKFLLSILSSISTVLMTFTVFKIPLKQNERNIVVIGASLGVINSYTRFILESNLFPFLMLTCFTVLVMVLKRYPLFYSVIVCSTGFFITVLIDALISFAAIQLNVTSLSDMQVLNTHYVVLNAILTIINVTVAILLRRFDIGFSFIIRRFRAKHILKAHNFVWAALIVTCVIVIQFLEYKIEILSLHGYIFIGVALILLLTLLIAYRQNKKAVRDRFGR